MTGNGFAEHASGHRAAGLPLPGPFQIGLAKCCDIGAIRSIDIAAGRSPAEVSTLGTAIDDQARLVVVASTKGGIVGWGKTHFWAHADGPAPSGHYLGGVTVLPGFRRLGVARALTRARLDWIWERVETAWYVVNPANRASINLHRQWGFAEVTRAARFHTTTFTGGVGILMQAKGTREIPGLRGPGLSPATGTTPEPVGFHPSQASSGGAESR